MKKSFKIQYTRDEDTNHRNFPTENSLLATSNRHYMRFRSLTLSDVFNLRRKMTQTAVTGPVRHNLRSPFTPALSWQHMKLHNITQQTWQQITRRAELQHCSLNTDSVPPFHCFPALTARAHTVSCAAREQVSTFLFRARASRWPWARARPETNKHNLLRLVKLDVMFSMTPKSIS